MSHSGIGSMLAELLVGLVLGIVFVAAGTVVVMAWPRRVQLATATLSHSPWPVILVGVLTGLLLPFVLAAVSALLLITLVGALALPVVWLAALGLWVYGAVTVGLWMGQRVAESGRVPAARQSLLATTVLGLGLFVVGNFLVTMLVPPLGGLLTYMSGFVGVGAGILSRFGSQAPLSSMSRMISTGAGRVTRRLGSHGPEQPGSQEQSRRAS